MQGCVHVVYLQLLLTWYLVSQYICLFKDRGGYLATDLTNGRFRFGSEKWFFISLQQSFFSGKIF